MQRVADIIRLPTQIPLVNFEVECSPRSDCRGLTCNITLGTLGSNVGSYVADVTVDPCGESVRFLVVDTNDNDTRLDRTFDDSGSYPFTIGGDSGIHATLLIGMVHHNYSMDLSVS